MSLEPLFFDYSPLPTLDHAPLEPDMLTPSTLLLSTVVEEAIAKAQRNARRTDLTMAAHDTAYQVVADYGRLLQVFTSLLDRALRCSRQGGTLHIGAEQLEGEVVAWIADDCEHEETEQLESVLRRGWRPRLLGRPYLSVEACSVVVELLGGRLWQEPMPDGGSTVFISLPSP